MKLVLGAALLAAVGLIAIGLYVRLAPVAPERWHVDPLMVEPPNKANHYLLRPLGG